MTALKKRILIIVFTVIFILAGIGALVVPLTKINSLALEGAGTESSPYLITSADDLKSLRDSVNNGNSYSGMHFRVTRDIDLKYATFTPIGSKNTTPFMGNFDGDGHTINGLFVQVSNAAAISSRVGLFGYISGATVKNLTIEDGNVFVSAAAGASGGKGANNAAGKAGTAAVDVVAAGVVGNAVSSSLTNLQFKGLVYAFGGNGGNGGEGGKATSGAGKTGGAGAKGSDVYAGGIVGEADGTVISNSSFVGTMYASGGAGGTGGHGYNAYSGKGGYGGKGGNAGTVRLGGIAGYVYQDKAETVGSISNCYTNAYLRTAGGTGGYGGAGRSATGTNYGGNGGAPGARATMYTGGIVGESNGKIENCFAVGKLEVKGSVAGLGGNGGYGNNGGAATAINRLGVSGGRSTVNNYNAVGGIVGCVNSETSIKNVYSDMSMTEKHQLYYYNVMNTRLAGIAGVITAPTEITNAVSLNTYYEGDKNTVGNAFSPLATYSDQTVALAVDGAADNIKYPTSVTYVNHTPNSMFVSDFSAMGERCSELSSVTNLSLSGTFAGFSTDIWEISAVTNNGRPTLKNLKFKEVDKITVEANTRDDLLALSRKVNTGAPVYDVTININADIDLGEWTPIGTTRNKNIPNLVVNGNNHVLRNMQIDKTSDYKGFIGCGDNVVVNDLTIEDPMILGNGGNYVGGICGLAAWAGQFTNCHVTQSSKPSAQNTVITGKTYVGGIVGYNQGIGLDGGKIINCSNTVYIHCVTGANTNTGLYVAGIAGIMYFTDVEKCYATCDVYCDNYNTALSYYAGALIGGMFWSSTVTECFATGNVTTPFEGSFIAYVNTTCPDGKITNCYYTGSVTHTFSNSKIIVSGSSTRYGGLVTRLQATSVLESTGEVIAFEMTGNVVLTKNFYLKGNLATAGHKRFGNLYSQVEGYRAATQYFNTRVNTNMYPYIRNRVNASNNYYNSKRVWTKAATSPSGTSAPHGWYESTAAQCAGYDYYAQTNEDKENFFANTVGYDFQNTWIWNSELELPVLRSNAYNVPGMAGSAIEIATAQDMQDFRDRVNAGVNFAGKTIKLVNDIDLSGITWAPIGTSATVYFGGIFDGDGHTISNMYVNHSAANKGLFGTIVGGTVKNLTIKNPTIVNTAYANTGGLAGWVSANSTISDIQVIGGSISAASSYVGGVIGLVQNTNVKITRCSSVYDPDASANTNLNSKIYGNNYVGGVVGGILGTAANTATVTECYSSRNVSGANHYIGGLVGLSRGANYTTCYTTGAVSSMAGHNIGGLIGRMDTYLGSVSNCFTTGDVYAHSATAKISAYAGGIVGIVAITGCRFTNCYVAGDVVAVLNVASLYAAAGGIMSYANVKSTTVGGCAILSERIMASNYRGWVNTSSSAYFAYPAYFGNGNSTGVPTVVTGSANYYRSDCKIAPRTRGSASYCNTITAGKGAEARDPEFFTMQSTYSAGLGWDFVDIWEMKEGVNGGYPYLKALGAPVNEIGSRFNTLKINNKQDYADFVTNVNAGESYFGYHLEQTADLDVSGIDRAGYDLNHSFAGTFDGGNYKITKFEINQASANMGLFGFVKFAKFRNINLIKPKVTATGSNAYVGGLIGRAYSTIDIYKCDVAGGSVTGAAAYVGGLVGATDYGINYIQNSFATATVKGGNCVGGLVGYFRSGYVTSCYSRADVTGTLASGHSTGGLIGNIDLWCKIYDNYAMGNVSDTSASTSACAGGLIGRASQTGNDVQRCYFKGTVTANRTTKATSSAKTTAAYSGGIIGYMATANNVIKDCVSLATSIKSINGYSYLASQVTSRSSSLAVTNTTNFAISSTIVPVANKTLASSLKVNATTQLTAAEGVENPTAEDVIDNFKNTCATMLTSWNINNGDTWQLNPGLNEGLPSLIGMPPDNSELDALIETAKSYKAEDWNVETFTALQTVIATAEQASDSGTLTDIAKAEHIKALNDAIANLRPDKTKLQELYDEIMTEKDPYKEWFVNYVTMDAALADAKAKLEEDSNKFKNSDIELTLSTLIVANKNLIVSKFRLNEAIIKANLISEDDYRAEDIAAMKEIKMEAVTVNNDPDATAKAVCEATLKLEKCLGDLKVDKTNLQNKIKEAYEALGGTLTFTEEGLIEFDATNKLADDKFESMTAFNKAFADAVAEYENQDATGAKVAQVAYDLGVALNNLTLDKMPLNNLYTLAGLKQEDQYTADSWQTFKTAYDAAKVVLDKPAAQPVEFVARSQELDKALADLQAAFDGLKISKTKLLELINLAQSELATNSITQVYDDACVLILQTALDAAKVVYDNEDATSAEIDKAATDLNDAILNLRINIDFLRTKIAEAEKYLVEGVKEYYTETSINELLTAKDDAKAFVQRFDAGEFDSLEGEDKKTSIAEAKNVTKALQEKIKGLQADEAKLRAYIDRCLNTDNEAYIGSEKIVTIGDYQCTVKYAQETVTALTALANASQTMLDSDDKSNEGIIKAIKDFEYLFANMKADKTDLSELVREVGTWKNSKHMQDNDGNWILDPDTGELKVFVVYSTATWDNLQNNLHAAEPTVNDSLATLQQVEESFIKLVNAINFLQIDREELSLRVEKAAGRIARQETDHIFTEASIAEVVKHHAIAVETLDKIDSRTITIEEVQKVLDDLNHAINTLVIESEYIWKFIRISDGQTKPADPDDETSESNEKYYTKVTFDTLVAQTNLIRDVITDNDNLSEQDVDDFIKIIVDAMNGLVVTTTVIDEQIYAAESLDANYITAESYAPVSAAITAAKELLDSGRLNVVNYEPKFEAVEEMKEKIEALKVAIDNIQVDLAKYRAFINSKKTLLNEKYDAEGLEALSEAIAVAEDAPNYTTTVEPSEENEGHEAFSYTVAMQCIDDILAAEKALKPDVSSLQDFITQKTEEMNKKHVAPQEDEEGNIIADTVDPVYLGEDMYHYEYFTDDSYGALLKSFADAQVLINNAANYTIADVEAELAKLEAAYEALELDMSLLKDLVDDCNRIVVNQEKDKYYLEDSFNAFKKVLDECAPFLDSGSKVVLDYVNTYKKLDEAKNNLQFDTTALDALIKKAELIKANADKIDGDEGKVYYTAGSFEKLTTALQEAYSFAPDEEGGEEASAMALRAVCNTLSNAIDGMVDISALRLKLIEAKTYDNSENKYDADKFATLQTAIVDGTAVYEAEKSTADDVTEAISKLDEAIKALALDENDLLGLIEQAKAIVKEHDDGVKILTKKTLDELQKQIDEAEEFVLSGSLDDELKAARMSELYNAINGIVDIKPLKDKLDAADQFKLEHPDDGTWTAASYRVLEDTITAAKAVYDNTEATAEEVATHVTKLSDLDSILVPVPVVDENTVFTLIDENEIYKIVDEHGGEKEDHSINDPAYLVNLALNDTIADILTQFKNTEVKAFKADGETEITDFDNTKVATGIILRTYKDGEAVDQITLVVRGDINGDGKISAADKAQLNGYFNGTKSFEGAYWLACDINGDNKISAVDKAWFNGYFNGSRQLYDGLSVKVG